MSTPVTANKLPSIRTDGTRFVDDSGRAIRLRGVCLGGWLNMENFITGYAGNESLMRSTVRTAIGADRADRFFERLLTRFFDADDAAFLGRSGFNVARIAINYRHLESDDKPFEIIEDGFRHLDRAIELLARQGIYSIIDLHALPGSQNHHWHSDNLTHVAAFWQYRHFQDRVVNMWQAIATRYRDNTAVAGYNLINEPADETGELVGPVYQRIFDAVREIDADHTIYLDGNTYATDFSAFDEAWDNTVYVLHDYVAAGLGRGTGYPGTTDGVYIDRDYVEQKFLQRSEFARRTGTPLLVGEFGPIYTGDEVQDRQRRQILDDQLEIYRRYDVSWTLWMYKDLGRQGLVSVKPESPYQQRFGDFVAKKRRLSVDQWGSDGEGPKDITGPVQELIAREFPNFDPYPWGRFDWVRTMLLNLLIAQPMASEYADLMKGLDDSELDALADSFGFDQCQVRQSLLDQLQNG
ncbi:glycoside hydrolase family 5 protein [Microlunatus soli]|uniref:Aryl-phospho-beta-D-glucosidase BglC, GH1 family n=1 Tax=Microlunatus soli TaxID=630515 RepID=A0A1H1T791_9ACTN|nr:cellulase family glycosylhydrolase [Microlunatus soli]SDS56085.1 Aryl-phospho-beta-D-glucosidase BglC, GH1 family [Microlunatus soli]